MAPSPPPVREHKNPLEKLPDWSGETVALIGGGPSLQRSEVSALWGRCCTLAINRAYELAPWADLLYGYDGWFWKNFPKALNFLGPKASGQIAPRPVIQLPVAPRNRGVPFADPQKPIAMGYDSGYHAIQIAALRGASRILLLGFDGRANGNWHDGYKGRAPAQYSKAQALHRDLAVLLKLRGVECLNCTPNSSIDAYPRLPLKEALDG